MESFVQSNKSSHSSENTDEPKKKRGWPKGVPRGSPYIKKNSLKGRPPKVSIISQQCLGLCCTAFIFQLFVGMLYGY